MKRAGSMAPVSLRPATPNVKRALRRIPLTFVSGVPQLLQPHELLEPTDMKRARRSSPATKQEGLPDVESSQSTAAEIRVQELERQLQDIKHLQRRSKRKVMRYEKKRVQPRRSSVPVRPQVRFPLPPPHLDKVDFEVALRKLLPNLEDLVYCAPSKSASVNGEETDEEDEEEEEEDRKVVFPPFPRSQLNRTPSDFCLPADEFRHLRVRVQLDGEGIGMGSNQGQNQGSCQVLDMHVGVVSCQGRPRLVAATLQADSTLEFWLKEDDLWISLHSTQLYSKMENPVAFPMTQAKSVLLASKDRVGVVLMWRESGGVSGAIVSIDPTKSQQESRLHQSCLVCWRSLRNTEAVSLLVCRTGDLEVALCGTEVAQPYLVVFKQDLSAAQDCLSFAPARGTVVSLHRAEGKQPVLVGYRSHGVFVWTLPNGHLVHSMSIAEPLLPDYPSKDVLICLWVGSYEDFLQLLLMEKCHKLHLVALHPDSGCRLLRSFLQSDKVRQAHCTGGEYLLHLNSGWVKRAELCSGKVLGSARCPASACVGFGPNGLAVVLGPSSNCLSNLSLSRSK